VEGWNLHPEHVHGLLQQDIKAGRLATHGSP
jgi:hypothetical protein